MEHTLATWYILFCPLLLLATYFLSITIKYFCIIYVLHSIDTGAVFFVCTGCLINACSILVICIIGDLDSNEVVQYYAH